MVDDADPRSQDTRGRDAKRRSKVARQLCRVGEPRFERRVGEPGAAGHVTAHGPHALPASQLATRDAGLLSKEVAEPGGGDAVASRLLGEGCAVGGISQHAGGEMIHPFVALRSEQTAGLGTADESIGGRREVRTTDLVGCQSPSKLAQGPAGTLRAQRDLGWGEVPPGAQLLRIATPWCEVEHHHADLAAVELVLLSRGHVGGMGRVPAARLRPNSKRSVRAEQERVRGMGMHPDPAQPGHDERPTAPQIHAGRHRGRLASPAPPASDSG